MTNLIYTLAKGTITVAILTVAQTYSAAQQWKHVIDDPVWGNANVYSPVVTDYGSLETALNDVPTSSATPSIILVGNSIKIPEAYVITNKYVVLRKSNNGTQEPWNYNNNWITTKLDATNGAFRGTITPSTAVRTPDLYDGTPDFFLDRDASTPSGAKDRHFSIAGTTTLILENITLRGPNASNTVYNVQTGNDGNTVHGGGIDVQAGANFTFAGNITNCGNTPKTTWTGGAIGAVTKEIYYNLTVKGGVLWHNVTREHGGAVAEGAAVTISGNYKMIIDGYTILENNRSGYYGGAIHIQHDVTVGGDVIVRNNRAGSAGGAICGYCGNLTVTGNAKILDNYAEGPMGQGTGSIYSGMGGGINCAGNVASSITISGNALISGNKAERGGGGIGVGSSKYPNNVTLNLVGGTISNNEALGISRDLPATATNADRFAVGGGGGVYAYNPGTIFIPTTSTTKFSGNRAPYITLIDQSKSAPWWNSAQKSTQKKTATQAKTR